MFSAKLFEVLKNTITIRRIESVDYQILNHEYSGTHLKTEFKDKIDISL